MRGIPSRAPARVPANPPSRFRTAFGLGRRYARRTVPAHRHHPRALRVRSRSCRPLRRRVRGVGPTPTSVTLTPTASTITVWDSVTFKVASGDGTMLPLTGAAGLAAGSPHLRRDGRRHGGVWGSNGQRNALGARTALGYASRPVVVAGLSGAVALGAGPASSTTCALDGTAGSGVGARSTRSSTFRSARPGHVEQPATDVRVGWGHACALLADTTVECWTSDPRATVPPAIKKAEPVKDESGNPLSGVESVTAGYFQTCALLSDGTVQCWGSNTYGELGNGTTTTSTTAVTVSGLEGQATAITARACRACALMADVPCTLGTEPGPISSEMRAMIKCGPYSCSPRRSR